MRDDLRALAAGPESDGPGTPWPEAAALADTLPSALGSLYVIEGSTLGGKLITRALAGTPWLPKRGLRFFDPYGSASGSMWRRFKEETRALASPGSWPETIAAAGRTFDLLRERLVDGTAGS